jgi:hypothetical protein
LRQRRLLAPAFALLLASGCASAPVAAPAVPAPGDSPRVALLTPLDGVPVRSLDVFAGVAEASGLEPARARSLALLRDDLAAALRARGLDVVEIDAPAATGPRPAPTAAAALGRAAGADEVVVTRLVAYGDIRRSWLWILGAQALAAGIGHGVVVAAATGDSTLGWWAGGGEFLLETATWVGGALVGSRVVDPVVVRVWLVRASDGAVLGHWTREGARPFKNWFRRRGEPPRAERLRAVAGRIFAKLAPKLGRRARSGLASGAATAGARSRPRAAPRR